MHYDNNLGIVVVGIHTSSYIMRCKRLPAPGEYLIASSYEKSLDGGKASNQALAAARLGAKSYLVARIGNDEEGRFSLNYLRSNGVDTTFTTISDSLPTGIGTAFMDSDGIPMGSTYMGANIELSKDHINAAMPVFERSKVLLVQLEISADLSLYACNLAKEHGLIVIFNPAPADNLDVTSLEGIDILTPNEPEVKILAGYSPYDDVCIEDAGKKLFKTSKVKNLIITMGKKGSMLINKDGTYSIPCPALKAVDTSGAGDCYNAALAFSLLNNVSMFEATEFASKVSSLSVTRHQVWPSYPTLEEVRTFYGAK